MKTELIYGFFPVLEAIRSGKELDRLLIQRDLRRENTRELLQLARDSGIPWQQVPLETLDRLVKANHQGIVAWISHIEYQSLDDIIPFVFEKGEAPFLVMLDRITDVRNLGAIARSAECAGVHALIVPTKNTARFNSDAIKTSAGALEHLPVCRAASFVDTIKMLHSNGIQVIACSEKAEKNYTEVNFQLPTAIIMGSEEDGISTPIMKMADHKVRIPLKGKTESLNVSVAAGIILFEALKQREGH